jgi:YesN/AraC family two-component response regulator
MPHYAKRVTGLAEFATLEELERNASELVDRICDEFVQRQERENDDWKERILAYIDEHACEYEMTLERVADSFGMSVYYLSRMIKEWSGITFTELVTHRRLGEAKRRLISTDTPIQDIVSEVGYVNAASFTRKFKESEGVTPGQYRKLHREVP